MHKNTHTQKKKKKKKKKTHTHIIFSNIQYLTLTEGLSRGQFMAV